MPISRRQKYNRHVRRNDNNSNDDDSINEIGEDPPSSPPTHTPHLPTTLSRTTTSPHTMEFSPRRSPRLSNKMKKRHKDDEVQWRQMVTYYYRKNLVSPSEKSYRRGDKFQGWDGKEGVIKHLIDHFNLKHSKGDKKRIKIVLVTIREFASKGILYKGQIIKGQGRKPHINSPQEYHIIIDLMEQGYGLVTAMFQINEYREEKSLPNVGLSTVRRTMNHLGPVIRRIKRRKQGNRDPTSPLARARQRWVTQLLVRLGEHTFDCRAADNEHLELTDTPSFFNPNVLPPLILHQLVFFDECHKKCKSGRTGETVYSFPRNSGGVYDSEGDVDKVDTNLHVKYAKEGRFSFGVAAVKMHDGTVEGRRCRTFDYSAKNLITITGEEKMIRDEIKRVKTLATGGQWVQTTTALSWTPL
jgi:hypothetical protein